MLNMRKDSELGVNTNVYLQGNRGTRKLPAPDPKRSNGSISLLHLLQSRKSNLHRLA